MDVVTAVGHRLGRPGLRETGRVEEPLAHEISAPTTGSLTRVTLTLADERGPVEIRCVRKRVQAARHGLPPFIPAEVIAHLDTIIPWRLEVEVLTGDLAARMPAGLRAPDVLTAAPLPDDRIDLWMLDADPIERPWTEADTLRAAELLGRLAARRRDEPIGPSPRFLQTYRVENVGVWSLPQLMRAETWAHPLFAMPEVASLRPLIEDLAGRLPELDARLAAAPALPAHGDATPMNLLRPAAAPDDLVLLDWGSATPAPLGWDVVPLVFGRAEAGRQPVSEALEVLPAAVAAYADGLAAEGFDATGTDLTGVVAAAAQIRYAFTTLPLGALDGVPLPAPDPEAYTRRRAELVRGVLQLTVTDAPR